MLCDESPPSLLLGDRIPYTEPRAEFLVPPNLMASGAWPSSDTLSQCFTVVRWFHTKGTSWTGTAAQLAAELTSYCDVQPWFAHSDDLIAFFETNVVMLRELGLGSAIHRNVGQPDIIELTDGNTTRGVQQAPSDSGESKSPIVKEEVVPGPSAEAEAVVSAEPERAHPELPSLLEQLAKEEPADLSDDSSPNQPAERLYKLLGVPQIEILLDRFNPEKSIEPEAATPRRKGVPLLFLALLLVVIVATGFLVFARKARDTSARTAPAPVPKPVPAQQADTPTVVVTPEFPPEDVKRFEELLQKASSSREGAAQFDLGLVFAEGRGVKRDVAAAYKWLTLADTNGSAAAESAAQSLNLSKTEMQSARIAIAEAFIEGVSVKRDYLQAHRWVMRAANEGSPEAGALKKELEAKMFTWQIQQAIADESREP